MEQRLSFITLGVSDLKLSADFYENKFCWNRSEMSDEKIIFFQLDGCMLSLYDRNALAEDATIDPAGTGFSRFTLSYLAGSADEVDNLVGKLKKRGVKIVKEPQKVFWGGYSSYISDPDGFLWEIAYNPYL
jgi:uncharacterized protein